MILTYKYKLQPNPQKKIVLDNILYQQRILYNTLLSCRIDHWRKLGKGLSYNDQQKELTEWRQEDELGRWLPANLQRWTIRMLDNAYNSFFQRIKQKSKKNKKGNKGEKTGFPRFKSENRFNTFGFAEFSGIQLIKNRLRFKGMPGSLRIYFHRELPSNYDIKSCTFTKKNNIWYIGLQIEVEVKEKVIIDKIMGMDAGITNLVITDTNEVIDNIRPTEEYADILRRKQRKLARCKRGSQGRKKIKLEVGKIHQKIKNVRNTYLHQVTSGLVKRFDCIIHEDLNVKGLARGFLPMEVHDASWGKLFNLLDYKAEKAHFVTVPKGKAGKLVIDVDPRYTSQDCSNCGTRIKKTLKVRTHNCTNCGIVLDRDHNSGREILRRGLLKLDRLVQNGDWVVLHPGILNVVC